MSEQKRLGADSAPERPDFTFCAAVAEPQRLRGHTHGAAHAVATTVASLRLTCVADSSQGTRTRVPSTDYGPGGIQSPRNHVTLAQRVPAYTEPLSANSPVRRHCRSMDRNRLSGRSASLARLSSGRVVERRQRGCAPVGEAMNGHSVRRPALLVGPVIGDDVVHRFVRSVVHQHRGTRQRKVQPRSSAYCPENSYRSTTYQAFDDHGVVVPMPQRRSSVRSNSRRNDRR